MMTNVELNEYILHYLKEDRTKSAIMLTAGWGTGKSYYIQNDLIPFLSKEENGAYSCLVISLYGLKTLEDISKSLYFESRMKFLRNNSEKAVAGKFVAKTVAKGITSFFGIDLSKSEEELQELYKSIDFSNKLIVLEDVERSKIDISEILSYVYNLVSEDEVKVLLVINEDEILTYHDSEPGEKGNTYKIPDEDAALYLKTKEKTISDTITYRGNLHDAILNLLQDFNCRTFQDFFNEDRISNIIDVMKSLDKYNLRSFQFACQKAFDILQKLEGISDKYIETIFFSILAFTMQVKDGKFPDWDGTDFLSMSLGINRFPLYRFCYDYIRWQEFDAGKIQKTFDAHEEMILYNKYGNAIYDEDLNAVFMYYAHSEKEVLTALHNIEGRLDNPKDIPLYSYCKLAYYLVACHTILEFDYLPCKGKMVLNMQKYGKNIDADMLLLNVFEHESEKEKQLFMDFLQDLRDAINISTCAKFEFSYQPEDLDSFCYHVVKNKSEVVAGRTFISKFDLERIVNMIFQCNPAQILCLRDILFGIYRDASKTDFLDTDCLFMNEMVEKIKSVLTEKESSMDRITLLQLNYMIKNLQEFIETLS